MMWNTSNYGALVASIGMEKADSIFSMFWSDLCTRFQIEDKEMLRKDAHIIKSSAGLLGFVDLGMAAEALEATCLLEDSSDKRSIALRSCRSEANKIIVHRRTE